MASLPTPGVTTDWGDDLNAAIESLHLGPDTHANRPTTGLTTGTLYSCSDHNLIYRWGGAAWTTYATLGGGGGVAVEDEGTQILATASRLNFAGNGVQVIDSGSGEVKVYISGMPDYSVDSPPSTPNAKDDEFNSSTGLWTTTPTAPEAMDAGTTRPSHLYIKSTPNSAALVGKYQSLPSLPCTVTAKITSHSATSGNSRTGIFVGPASPTNATGVQLCGWVQNVSGVQRVSQQLGGTWQGNGSTQAMSSQPLYLRVVVTSATSITFSASVDGWSWTTIETLDPGFTPAAVGVFVNSESTNAGPSAYFDWFRIT